MVITFMTTREAEWFIILVEFSVCLSDDSFRKPSCRKFIYAHPMYLQEERVKLVYKGHQIKVKVTGAKKVENSHSRKVTFGRP